MSSTVQRVYYSDLPLQKNPHFHDCHQIILVTGGEAEFCVNERSVRVRAGEIAIFSRYENHYREILQTAKKEYDDIPASDYYRDGYNLYLRMEKYMSNHLLFLHNHEVPPTNNEAERLLRNYKRKQQQAVTFRSFDTIEAICQCMSMLIELRQKECSNVFNKVSQILG